MDDEPNVGLYRPDRTFTIRFRVTFFWKLNHDEPPLHPVPCVFEHYGMRGCCASSKIVHDNVFPVSAYGTN